MIVRGNFTGILAIVAEVAGEEAARRLARARGGVRCYIPRRAKPGHWLVELLGEREAQAVCDAIGPGEVEVPLAGTGRQADARRHAAELLQRGWSNARVARAVGVSERTIKRLRARMREQQRQPDLFRRLDARRRA